MSSPALARDIDPKHVVTSAFWRAIMSNDVAERTISVIAEHLGRDSATITRDTHLDELGVNSLELTEIVMELEDLFDVEIDQNAAEAWASLKNVGNIIDAIEKLAKAKA
jgi:nodulation protein F